MGSFPSHELKANNKSIISSVKERLEIHLKGDYYKELDNEEPSDNLDENLKKICRYRSC